MDTLCGLSFKLSVPSFYQVNPAQAEVLYGRALDFAALTGVETVLDLYCGIGTISLLLARSAGKVYGVETVPEAVEDAEENAARNSIANAEFFCADAGEAAARFSAQGIRPQVVCGPAPEGPCPRGNRDCSGHVARAGCLCLLRPGHPGAGCRPVFRSGLSRPKSHRRGYVPTHCSC